MKTEQSSNRTAYIKVKAQSVPNGSKPLVKATKTIYRAEIPQLGIEECTVVQFEAENPDGAEAVEIARDIVNICSRRR
ncbi:hypothetical protein V5O48_006773, partial [Marasmius crinis-equi]